MAYSKHWFALAAAFALACSSSANKLTGATATGAGGNASGSGSAGNASGSGAGGPCGGNTCAADEECCASACVATSSCSFALTNVAPQGGYLSGGDWLMLSGAGFAKGLRVYLVNSDGHGDGRAAVRVLDQTTALVRTPPGPLGLHDVRIELGGQKASLRGAFQYEPGELKPPWSHVSMSSVRGEWPGLAVLKDGRVLIAGGAQTPDEPASSLASADLFSRDDTGQGKSMPVVGSMSTGRSRAGAVTLLDGKVLVVGGACWSGMPPQATAADLFDPASDAFIATAPLNKPRCDARALLLPDGRAFITSGNDPSAEIYDPDAKTFTLVAPTAPHPDGFFAVLRDGRVLLAGGLGANATDGAEVFDPDAGTFAPVGSLKTARYFGAIAALPDGRAILMGGAAGNENAWTPLDSIELFDPLSGAFTAAPYKLTVPRYGLAAALVRDGTVLAIAGYTTPGDCSKVTGSVDVIDPLKAKVADFGSELPEPNAELNAVTTLDGSVVVVGGGACGQPFAQPYIDFLPGQTMLK